MAGIIALVLGLVILIHKKISARKIITILFKMGFSIDHRQALLNYIKELELNAQLFLHTLNNE